MGTTFARNDGKGIRAKVLDPPHQVGFLWAGLFPANGHCAF